MYFPSYTYPNYYVKPMPDIQYYPRDWGYEQPIEVRNQYPEMNLGYRGENRVLIDQGKQPYVINIEDATKENNTFRTAIWTGDHLQVTLMSIGVGEDIGLEVHPDVDQFLRIEEGQGFVQMGDAENNLSYGRWVFDDDAIMVPAGKWHNLTNTGNKPLKLYTIYAPPEHPFGTVHQTKADAMAAEEGNGHRKES